VILLTRAGEGVADVLIVVVSRQGPPPNNGAKAIRSCMASIARLAGRASGSCGRPLQADFAALSRTAVPASAHRSLRG
jgi:hypothetical protein